MTEAEWLASDDPEAMLRLLWGRATDRKLQLLATACCQLAWGLLDDRCRTAVQKLEQGADDPQCDQLIRDAYHFAQAAYLEVGIGGRFTAAAISGVRRACGIRTDFGSDSFANLFANLDVALERSHSLGPRGRFRLMSDVLREVLGSPLRPVVADPAWLTSTVAALAAGVYDERAFDRLPILADALQDAGCEDAAVLDHCRGPGPHARGCWVVDMLLGKS